MGFSPQVTLGLGPAVPQLRFGDDFSPLNPISYSHMHSKFPDSGGNIPIRMSYVKYESKSTVCNTRWPGIRIKCALPSNFPYLQYEVCTDGRIGCLTLNWASTQWVQRGSGRGSASPCGFESGDSNLSKLTECFCGYAINWDPAWVSGRLCVSPCKPS
jgi:hypothetical protein